MKFKVACAECEVILGVVTEVELEDRPGIFVNISKPKNIPKRCNECGGVTVRQTN